MLIVNLDFLNAIGDWKYHWDTLVTERNETAGNLGANINALNFSSYYFVQNTGSLLIIFGIACIVFLLTSLRSLAIRNKRMIFDQNDCFTLFKTVFMMNFSVASLIIVMHIGDDSL